MVHSVTPDVGSTLAQAASKPNKTPKMASKGHAIHTSPKNVVKSLRRAYSASIACMETQIRLATHSSVLHKKFALDLYTHHDLQEVRKICEDLVYIIQYG